MAAPSLSSAEAEEREPTGVFGDEAGCMGLIFWLSGVPVYCSNRLCSAIDRMSRAKFWRLAGIADYLVRLNQVGLIINPLQRSFKQLIQTRVKVLSRFTLERNPPGQSYFQVCRVEIHFVDNVFQLCVGHLVTPRC